MLALMIAALAFAFGSIWSRGLQTGVPSLQFIGMQMLCGGALLGVVGLATGEPWRLRFDVGLAPYAALLYLALAGSLAGFTLYAWLLRVAPPAVVGTYACVNPIVAVALGVWLADEVVTWRTAAAGALVVASVGIIAAVRLSQSQSTWLTGLRTRLGWNDTSAARSP
jgi:drug/metabolite transporter (DMT)-like permease